MKKQLSQVSDFHAAVDSHAPTGPTNELPDTVRSVRIALIKEEAAEVIAAIKQEPLDHIAKELADLLYVTLGTVHAFGLSEHFEEIFDAVHASNMGKVQGTVSTGAYGKVQKQEGYRKPDIDSIIRRNDSDSAQGDSYIRTRVQS